MDRTNQIIKLHHITNELMVMMQRLNEIEYLFFVDYYY